MSIAAVLKEFAPSFSGQLLQPSDAGYDDARRVHNGLIDKHPAVVARCRGVADVIDAVRLAKTLHLDVAVRGGGHNVAGRATIDDGVMIDLSLMKGIHVDPVARTARAQGGVLWKEFNRETQLHGLATTGGVVGTTGIAGLTLGGGLGWLMTKHGLALDNLRSAELVMADGRVLRASQTENPGSLLGNSRRRRQLRDRDVARVQPARCRSNNYRRACRAPVREDFRCVAILQRTVRDGLRRYAAVCRVVDSARRI